MNILLIFFALPIATIIVSIALQKILKCPPLVAAIIFAIFLVVTFIINSLTFLVATIVYTIISFITAAIVWLICKILERERRNRRRDCDYDRDRDRDRDRDCNWCRFCDCDRDCDRCRRCGCNRRRNNNGNDLLTISSNGFDGTSNDLLTISSNDFSRNNNNNSSNCNFNNNCGCNGNNDCDDVWINNNDVNARINVIPNSNNNGRRCCFCGSFRRR